jgi:hypothetical protein
MQEELMTRTTFRIYLSRIVLLLFGSPIKDPRFDLSVRIQTRSMEEKTFSTTLEAVRKGQCIVVPNSKLREVKTNLFFPTSFFDLSLRTLRTKTRRELYISVAHEIICAFGFPFNGKVSTTHPQLFFFYFQQTPIISTL